MVQPFDYTLKTPSTTESFLAGIQSYQNQQKAIAAQTAAQAEQDKVNRARSFSLRAQQVAKDPKPENLSALYAEFPEYGADLDRFGKSLAANDKRTYGSVLQNAIIAKDSNKTPEEIAAIYTSGAEAARNSNRTDIAEKFDAAAQMALNPNMNDNFAARSLYNAIDPEGYKLIADSAVKLDTSTIKELVAEGFVPGTPEFKAALTRERTKVTTTLPGGGFYSGSEEGLTRILGGQPAPTNVQKGPPRQPTTKEEYDKLPVGALYIAPNGETYEKLGTGGQTATPSGNFQGQ
jgi:propanediol dehydratase small subunit